MTLLQLIATAWLVLTIGMSAYICFRWTTVRWFNVLIKLGYAFIALFGSILFYHRVIMGLPL